MVKKCSGILAVVLAMFMVSCNVEPETSVDNNLTNAMNTVNSPLIDMGDYYLYGGDIMLSKYDSNHLNIVNSIINNNKCKNNISTKGHRVNSPVVNLWNNNTVNYYFSTENGGFHETNKNIIRSAMRILENICNIKFIESDYGLKIFISPVDACRAILGEAFFSYFEYAPRWGSVSVCVHELCHVLGMSHEHQRDNRDSYVRINYNNIANDAKMWFDKDIFFSTDFGSYDFDSIMHYGSTTFQISSGLNTIETIDPTYQNVIGQGSHLSYWDIQTLQYMYGTTSIKNKPNLFSIFSSVNTSTVKLKSGYKNYQGMDHSHNIPYRITSLYYKYLMGDINRDGYDDLICIMKTNTGTKKTEIHILNGANNFSSYLQQSSIPIEENTDSFDFHIADYNRDGILDLYCIKKFSTGSGKTEVHVLNGANNFQSFIAHISTILNATDSRYEFGIGDYNRDGIADLFIIQKSQTGTHTTEVHVLNGGNSFQSFILHTGTILHETDASFTAKVFDWNYDGFTDILFIKKYGTGSGKVELHILNGATTFTSFLIQQPTSLPAINPTFNANYDYIFSTLPKVYFE